MVGTLFQFGPLVFHRDVDTLLAERPNPSMRATTNESEDRRRQLTDEVDQHVPLSSVVGGVGQQELHQPAVHRFLPLGRLHAGMQEVVAALHLQGPPNTNISTADSIRRSG